LADQRSKQHHQSYSGGKSPGNLHSIDPLIALSADSSSHGSRPLANVPVQQAQPGDQSRGEDVL